MPTPRVRIRLFGPFALWLESGEEVELRSGKAMALIAMVVSAPDGKRTRAFLQDRLWPLSGTEHGRASLRQCLSAMKKLMGPELYDAVFVTANDHVRIRPDAYTLVGTAADGEFLEGLDIPSEGFNDWLREERQSSSLERTGGPGVPAVPASAAAPPDASPARSAAASATRIRSPGALLPTVAVIPFAGMDREGLGSHFGDAIAQDITRSLSRSSYLAVISHLSSRSERLRTAALEDLKDLLSADYIITGHVRLSGERFRLDVDFVDAQTGQLCWTRDFEGRVQDFFDGNEEVVQTVSDAITREVFAQSLAPLSLQRVPDIETHRLMTAGITLLHRQALGGFSKARECIEEVIGRAPGHALPHAWLAKWYVLSIHQGWSIDAKRDLATAQDAASTALDLNPSCPFSLAVSGFVYHHLRRFDEAFDFHEAALVHDPNNALAWLMTATLHMFKGEGEAAVQKSLKATRLSPVDPRRYFFDCITAGAYAVSGDFDTALVYADRSYEANRRHASTVRTRAFVLEMLGQHQEAQHAAQTLLQLDPSFTIDKYRSLHPAMHSSVGDTVSSALKRAGVPSS